MSWSKTTQVHAFVDSTIVNIFLDVFLQKLTIIPKKFAYLSLNLDI